MRGFRTILLAGVAAGGLALPASAATVENLTYNLGSLRIVVPLIETTGRMSDADLRALTDGGSSATLAQRLARLDAALISVPQIRVDLTQPGGAQTLFTYRDVKLTNVTAGMIDTLALAGASADLDGPTGKAMATYGAMSVRRVNLGLMLRMLSTARTDENEPLQSLYEDFSAEGMTLSSDDADMTLGRITGSGTKGRALAVPLTELARIALSTGQTPTLAERTRLMLMGVDLLQSTQIGRAEARDIKMKMKKGAPGELTIGRLVMSGIASARLGEIAYEDLRMSTPDGRFALGRFAMTNIDLSRTLAAVPKLAQKDDLTPLEQRALMPRLGGIEIAQLAATFAGKSVTLGRFDVALGNYVDVWPTMVKTRIENLSVPVPDTQDRFSKQLAAIGITKVDLSANLDLAWNPATRDAVLNDLSLRMPALGVLKVAGKLTQVPEDVFTRGGNLSSLMAMDMRFKQLDVHVENFGGVEKGFTLAAAPGVPPAQMQKDLAGQATMLLPVLLGNHPSAQSIGAAVSKFLLTPKTLDVGVASAQGLPVSELMALSNPVELLGKLQVSARAGE